ncbi:MAG: hypothetical protein HY475_03220 [Candidatus Terrybacteria bacterium]|nr:hypothetical protein [Candidatus Terrybacteria bacterium]
MAVRRETRQEGQSGRAHGDWDPTSSRTFLREVSAICARMQSPELFERTFSDLMARCERGEVVCDARVLGFFRQLPEVMRLTRGEGGSHGTSQTMRMASWERDATEMISLARRDSEWLNRFWSSFMTAFERNGAKVTGEKLRNGILGALGTKHLLELLHYDARVAPADLDVHYGIDLLAKPQEEGGRRPTLAVQAKAFNREERGVPDHTLTIALVRVGEGAGRDPEAVRLQQQLARLKSERPDALGDNAVGLLVRLPRLWQDGGGGRPRPFLHEQTGQIDKAFFPVIQERLQQNAKDLFPPRERSAA